MPKNNKNDKRKGYFNLELSQPVFILIIKNSLIEKMKKYGKNKESDFLLKFQGKLNKIDKNR